MELPDAPLYPQSQEILLLSKANTFLRHQDQAGGEEGGEGEVSEPIPDEVCLGTSMRYYSMHKTRQGAIDAMRGILQAEVDRAVGRIEELHALEFYDPKEAEAFFAGVEEAADAVRAHCISEAAT